MNLTFPFGGLVLPGRPFEGLPGIRDFAIGVEPGCCGRFADQVMML